jgi:hypothetical protein
MLPGVPNWSRQAIVQERLVRVRVDKHVANAQRGSRDHPGDFLDAGVDLILEQPAFSSLPFIERLGGGPHKPAVHGRQTPVARVAAEPLDQVGGFAPVGIDTQPRGEHLRAIVTYEFASQQLLGQLLEWRSGSWIQTELSAAGPAAAAIGAVR